MNDINRMDEQVVLALRKLYHGYGYSQFKMSKFEPYDLYMQNKEFLVSGGIITFTDTDGTLMALKPDVTLSIVKNFRKESAHLQKVCYDENVYRIAGAGHNYHEIMQTGLECLGQVGMYEICEVVCLAVRSLLEISDDCILDLSHMGVLACVLKELQLNDMQSGSILRYLAEKNKDAVVDMLGPEKAAKLTDLMDITGSIASALPRLRKIVNEKAVDQLKILAEVLNALGLADKVHLDFSIVSDSNYYNDFVFRGYIQGIPTAVLAGGQYDRLMDKMNKGANGIGFAVYLDQLELLDRRNVQYDIDTVLLYEDSCDLAQLSQAVQNISDAGVFLSHEAPKNMKYRRLLKWHDGRLMTIEENG